MLKINRVENAMLKGEVILPASKSISNRYLIIQAMNTGDFFIRNLSKSNDTILLQNALKNQELIIDFEDAGTPMRFFLAYAAFKNMQITISGSEGLKTRPIGLLVDALSQLGCLIEYTGNNGFIPVRITKGMDMTKNKVVIDSTVSSQFISALLLVAPGMPEGLTIELKGVAVSMPYIDLTIDCMKRAGVNVTVNGQKMIVPSKPYFSTSEIDIETDWSAATFIYAWVAVSENADIFLPGLKLESVQGDRVIAFLFELFGVLTKVENGGIRLSKSKNVVKKIKIDFTAMPDAFPAIVATCVALGVNATFTGIKNLAVKESNRLLAMKENLLQTGAILHIENEQLATITYTEEKAETYHFKSFNDHRIAMACSIFAIERNVTIDDEKVVKKSFPEYWEIMRNLGILN